MEPFLYHGIKRYNIDLLEKILESGYLKPRCELEEGLVTNQNNIFNGTKYISLSQKTLYDGPFEPEGHIRVSYNECIYGQICLVFKPDNIKLIYPNVIDLDFLSPEEWDAIKFKDDEQRYTYYEDEVQTKERIPLNENLIAIGLPIDNLKYTYGEEKLEETISRLREILKEKGIDAQIVDSTRFSFADDYDKIEQNKIEPKGLQR